MSMYQPDDETSPEVIKALAELYEMGLIEVVGISEDGEWLYASTEEGKKVAGNWIA